MPNRIIKETIHTSETVNEMTDAQFRLWVSLITYVDDYGRGDARPAIIKGACFPLSERITVKSVKTALDGLVKLGCIHVYEVDGKPFLFFPNWGEHQRIRQKQSKCPPPPGCGEEAQDCGENDPIFDELPRVAADCGELPQSAARARAESESESESEYINTHSLARAHAREEFTPPTEAEVEAYIREKGYAISAKRFCAYYKARNWREIEDWRAAVDSWSENGVDDKKPPSKGKPGKLKDSSFDDSFFDIACKRSYSDDKLIGDLKQMVGVTA